MIKIKIPEAKHPRPYWPLTLVEESYTGELHIFEGFSAIVIPKPNASSKDIAKTLELLTQDFKYRAKKEEQAESSA